MKDERNCGITHAIREKLGFTDANLWRRFLARRLELIDDLDLCSRKASEQQDEIRKVAHTLRVEFLYDAEFFFDFEKLVRAAVQSARRNRKRCWMRAKRPRLDENDAKSTSDPKPNLEPEIITKPIGEEPHLFLSQISNLNPDGLGSVYDMSYSTSKVIVALDRSRAAIDSIIRPSVSGGSIQLPPLLNMMLSLRNLDNGENDKTLLDLKLSLLWLMKKSKLCLSLAGLHENESFKTIGQMSIAAVSALMFQMSFSCLTQTSVDYLHERISSLPFQARFYRSLDPECPVSKSLDDEAAVTTLQMLIGYCVKDFGYDSVLYLVGEAFYLLILQEYPLVLRTSVHFKKPVPETVKVSTFFGTDSPHTQPVSLNNISVVSAELRSQETTQSASIHVQSNVQNSAPRGANSDIKSDSYTGTQNRAQIRPPANIALPYIMTPDPDKKQVTLRFLSSSLNFKFPIRNSAPPRFVEIVDNAKQAFKLNDSQIYGIRNCKSGAVINTDFDLEQIFAHEKEIELEVFTQQCSKIPLSQITSSMTPSSNVEDTTKILLPLPVLSVLPSPSVKSVLPAVPRGVLMPRFQPLL